MQTNSVHVWLCLGEMCGVLIPSCYVPSGSFVPVKRLVFFFISYVSFSWKNVWNENSNDSYIFIFAYKFVAVNVHNSLELSQLVKKTDISWINSLHWYISYFVARLLVNVQGCMSDELMKKFHNSPKCGKKRTWSWKPN